MVIGAGWMGARAMTSTAGPGMSLMAEFTGLGYYAEVPAVIFDVQRAGPSTGLPTRTGQQDILSTAVLSHGDTKHPMLLPSSVTECYTMAMEAFDLAERLQTPVFVMSDLDLGMNTWMSKPFDYPTKPFNRGKRLDADKLKQLGEFAPLSRRGRRRHSVSHGAGRRHASVLHARLGPQREGAVQRARRRLRRTTSIGSRRSSRRRARWCRSPRSTWPAEGGIGLIAYGTTHWAIVESRDQLKNERGINDVVFAAAGVPVHEESSTSSTRTTASTSSSRIATRRCVAAAGWNATRSRSPSCGASGITPGCRSTAGR